MKNDVIYIYGLICPIINRVRYIGKSIDPKTRLKQHLLYESDNKTHKGRWLNFLKKHNKVPSIVILEEIFDGNWEVREVYWINKLKTETIYLTNATKGGDGISAGYKHTKEFGEKITLALKKRSKEFYKNTGIKISKSLTGRTVSLQARSKISKEQKQNWINLPVEEKEKILLRLPQANTGIKRNNSTSKYRGVSWFKRDKCWRAWITIRGTNKFVHLGYYKKEIDAAKAYNNVAIKYRGESAHLNVIE